MEPDEEGFHYPHVDRDVCIGCGLCEKACPLLAPKLKEESVPINYVAQNCDEDILMRSTSGGVYSAISAYVISKGGVVFGAAFDEDMVLRHTYSETLEGCGKFRGSKYVQSLIGDSYRMAKEFLDMGRMVAFSGTPCQIAGLIRYLEKRKYQRLILVDLVCRGTPSPRVLAKYLAFHASSSGGQPVQWLSRDKYYGYDLSAATILYKGGVSPYHGIKGNDFMLTAYFNGLISRPSCYNCHFKTLHRISDLTLFDCWDAQATSKRFSRKGATNVLVHTERGQQVWDQIKESFIYAESDIETTMKRDGVMIHNNPPMDNERGEFFKDLHAGKSIPELWKRYSKQSKISTMIAHVKPVLYKMGIWSIYMRMKKPI